MKKIALKIGLIAFVVIGSAGLSGCGWLRALFGLAAEEEGAPIETAGVRALGAGVEREVNPGVESQERLIETRGASESRGGSISRAPRALEPGEPLPSIGPASSGREVRLQQRTPEEQKVWDDLYKIGQERNKKE